MIDLILLFIGSFIANTMSAFAGGGAGLVQLPVLLLLGLDFPIALATHKIANVALGFGASYRFFKEKGLIELKFAAYIVLVGIIGSMIGAIGVVQIPGDTAKMALAIIIIMLGIYSAFKKNLGQLYEPKNRHMRGYALGSIGIFAIAIFNGSLTAGSGLFLTLWLIKWFGVDYKRAVAYTMSLVGVVWNATSAITINALGEPIYWAWVPVLLVASFLGGYTGAHFNTLKGNAWVKWAFTAVTLLSGISLLVR